MALTSESYLERAADEELRRSVSQHKVGSFEDISAGPHDHHRKTHPIGGLVLKVSVELGNSKHRLSKDCHKSNRVYKPREVNQEVHQEAACRYNN